MWRRSAGLLAAALMLAGCGGDDDRTGGAVTTPTSPSSPSSATPACEGGRIVELSENASLAVGDCLFVSGYSSKQENLRRITIQPPTAMTSLNERTFRAKTPGAVAVKVETFFNDCPNGPCAHPNPDKVFQIRIS